MPDLKVLLIIFIVILLIVLALAIIFRLIRIAIVLGVIVLLVPILCTIMWGDGSAYISKIATIFTSDIEESINRGYEEYREENAKNPIVDMNQLQEYFDNAGDAVKDALNQPVFPQK